MHNIFYLRNQYFSSAVCLPNEIENGTINEHLTWIRLPAPVCMNESLLAAGPSCDDDEQTHTRSLLEL